MGNSSAPEAGPTSGGALPAFTWKLEAQLVAGAPQRKCDLKTRQVPLSRNPEVYIFTFQIVLSPGCHLLNAKDPERGNTLGS